MFDPRFRWCEASHSWKAKFLSRARISCSTERTLIRPRSFVYQTGLLWESQALKFDLSQHLPDWLVAHPGPVDECILHWCNCEAFCSVSRHGLARSVCAGWLVDRHRGSV